MCHTVSVIVKVQQLIAPLGDNSKSIFQECNHNEEPANCWQISARCMLTRPRAADMNKWPQNVGCTNGDIRLYWVAQSIQEIFDLARLFPDRIERTRVIVGISTARTSKWSLASQVIASCASNLGHDGISVLLVAHQNTQSLQWIRLGIWIASKRSSSVAKETWFERMWWCRKVFIHQSLLLGNPVLQAGLRAKIGPWRVAHEPRQSGRFPHKGWLCELNTFCILPKY
jgi:hypothetical protein